LWRFYIGFSSPIVHCVCLEGQDFAVPFKAPVVQGLLDLCGAGGGDEVEGDAGFGGALVGGAAGDDEHVALFEG